MAPLLAFGPSLKVAAPAPNMDHHHVTSHGAHGAFAIIYIIKEAKRAKQHTFNSLKVPWHLTWNIGPTPPPSSCYIKRGTWCLSSSSTSSSKSLNTFWNLTYQQLAYILSQEKSICLSSSFHHYMSNFPFAHLGFKFQVTLQQWVGQLLEAFHHAIHIIGSCDKVTNTSPCRLCMVCVRECF